MSRSMRTLGMETQLVFASGQRVDYPRYRISSNGFVRGPRNEQVGRGEGAVASAAQACTDQIQAWLDRMNRFGDSLCGVAWPVDLMYHYDQMTRNVSSFQGSAPFRTASVIIKAQWSNDPDCFDIYRLTWGPSVYNSQARVSLEVYTMPLRIIPLGDAPSPIDSNGTIDQKYVPLSDPVEFERLFNGNVRKGAEILLDWVDELHPILTQKYTSFTSSTPLNELRDNLKEFLDGSKHSVELVPLLKRVAKLYKAMGFSVEDQSTEGRVKFKVIGDEHIVEFSNNSVSTACQFVQDEERLTSLYKMRLEDEYHKSMRDHGDLTGYDPNEDNDDSD